MRNSLRKLKKPIVAFTAVVASLAVGATFASYVTSGIPLSELASNVGTTVTELGTVLTDISLISGIGFVLASFFKFHQHKLNPTQVPVSQGVTLLLIGAGLVLFPTMLTTGKRAIFGTQAEIASISGGQISSIIGGD